MDFAYKMGGIARKILILEPSIIFDKLHILASRSSKFPNHGLYIQATVSWENSVKVKGI